MADPMKLHVVTTRCEIRADERTDGMNLVLDGSVLSVDAALRLGMFLVAWHERVTREEHPDVVDEEDVDVSLAMKIAKVIITEQPGILNHEDVACATGAHALAINLGGMLAPTVLRNELGDAMELVTEIITANATKTAAMIKSKTRRH